MCATCIMDARSWQCAVYAAARMSCPASPEHLKVSSRRRTEAPRHVITTIICIREAVEREYKKPPSRPFRMEKLRSPSARISVVQSLRASDSPAQRDYPTCTRPLRPCRQAPSNAFHPVLVLQRLYLNPELLLPATRSISLQLYFPHFPHYFRVSIAVSRLTATPPPTPLYPRTPHHDFTAQQDGQGRSCRCRRRHWSGENEVVELQNHSNRTQPLSLLLKQNQHVTELALYDVVNSPGVATDLSHISSPAVRASPHTSQIHKQELTTGRKSQGTYPRTMA